MFKKLALAVLLSILFICRLALADSPQKTIPSDGITPVAVMYIENADGTYSRINSVTPFPMTGTVILGSPVDGTYIGDIKFGESLPMTLARKESTQDLGAGALSYTTNFAAKTRVKHILFKASGNITQTVTFTFDSVTAGTYDTILASEDLVTEANYVYIPGEDLILASGDEILVACTNDGTPAIDVYVTVVGELLN